MGVKDSNFQKASQTTAQQIEHTSKFMSYGFIVVISIFSVLGLMFSDFNPLENNS